MNENESVKNLRDKIRKVDPNIYFWIDQDHEYRIFTTGFDFFMAYGGKTLFCEAKKLKTDGIDPEKKMRDSQSLTRLGLISSNTPYYVVCFVENGADFVRKYYLQDNKIKFEDIIDSDIENFLVRELYGNI